MFGVAARSTLVLRCFLRNCNCVVAAKAELQPTSFASHALCLPVQSTEFPVPEGQDCLHKLPSVDFLTHLLVDGSLAVVVPVATEIGDVPVTLVTVPLPPPASGLQ